LPQYPHPHCRDTSPCDRSIAPTFVSQWERMLLADEYSICKIRAICEKQETNSPGIASTFKTTIMISIHPYLNFQGNTEEAMNFYKSVFGGSFKAFQRFNDSPGHEKMPKHEQTMIMHASLPLGNGILMATDALESMGHEVRPGNNIYLSIITESEDEADRLFEGLSKGGKIEMPIGKTFWGAYFGICMDKFQVQWMITYEETK
jgi:PhnB protein